MKIPAQDLESLLNLWSITTAVLLGVISTHWFLYLYFFPILQQQYDLGWPFILPLLGFIIADRILSRIKLSLDQEILYKLQTDRSIYLTSTYTTHRVIMSLNLAPLAFIFSFFLQWFWTGIGISIVIFATQVFSSFAASNRHGDGTAFVSPGNGKNSDL